MARPKIILLTDSVALPRKFKEGVVQWEETYIYKLKTRFPDYEFINVSIGGASIKDLRKQVNYYKILEPQIVILHCGIVDAAPRAFGRIELELIKKAHLLRFSKPFVKFLRRYRGHHYAKADEFGSLLKQIKEALGAEKFITLGIIPASDDYEKIMPGIKHSIERYNQILQKTSTFLSTAEMPKAGICEDYHHINGIGQDYIFNLVKNCFE